MSPVPPIVHIAAATAAVFAALAVMPAISPDLPSSEPGVSQPRGLSGPGDPDSLMADGSFSKALADISDQLGGDDVTALDVTPTKIEVASGSSGSGTPIDEISSSAPSLLAHAIGQARKDRKGVTDVHDATQFRSLHFESDGADGVWTARLVSSLPAPDAYIAMVPGGAVAFEVHARPVAGP